MAVPRPAAGSDVSRFLFSAELPFLYAAASFENRCGVFTFIEFWTAIILHVWHHSPLSFLHFLFSVTVAADFCFICSFEHSLMFLQFF